MLPQQTNSVKVAQALITLKEGSPGALRLVGRGRQSMERLTDPHTLSAQLNFLHSQQPQPEIKLQNARFFKIIEMPIW